MAKNLIPQIAKMLGVELGEEFQVKGDNELTYQFTDDGLKLTHNSGIEISGVAANVALVDLLNGKDEVVKLPWKPKMFETYRSFDIVYGKLVVCYLKWTGLPYQYALLDKGWVYRTKEEAQAALPAVAKEIGVEYKL
nr:MAG: hypothetical protein [Bacteriophage sp.]